MGRPLSIETRSLVSIQVDCGIPSRVIALSAHVSERQVNRIRANKRQWGSVTAPLLVPIGRQKLIGPEQEQVSQLSTIYSLLTT